MCASKNPAIKNDNMEKQKNMQTEIFLQFLMPSRMYTGNNDIVIQ